MLGYPGMLYRAAGRPRTGDLDDGTVVLYQLSYNRMMAKRRLH
jgi:hypothetical protein